MLTLIVTFRALRDVSRHHILTEQKHSVAGFVLTSTDTIRAVCNVATLPPGRNMPWRPGTRRGRHGQAAELPGPLFTLYCQLEAYCDSVLAGELLGTSTCVSAMPVTPGITASVYYRLLTVRSRFRLFALYPCMAYCCTDYYYIDRSTAATATATVTATATATATVTATNTTTAAAVNTCSCCYEYPLET